MLKELTPEQKAAMPEVVREWTAIGLSTAKVDRAVAEAAIAEVYRCGGLTPPETIVWCGSPMAMIREVNRVLDAYPNENKGAARPNVSDCTYGSQEASWLAFYSFFRERCGLVKETDKLSGLFALARSCGWILPYEYVCFASERPSVIKTDVQGRTHCVDGPAIAFPNGDALYYVNGVEVPEEWITERDTLDPRLALTHPNLEQRACVARIVGWNRVLTSLSLRVIDDSRDAKDMASLLAYVRSGGYDFGRLVECDLPDEGTARFLSVFCPAHVETDGGERFVRVPPTMRTAREANAWTYGLTEAELMPEGRS